MTTPTTACDVCGGGQPMPPSALAAEQAAVGAAILHDGALAAVVDVADPDDFYRPAHGTVLRAALAVRAAGRPVDPITVAAELDRSGHLLRLGGLPYLHTLMAAPPTAANAAYYAEIVAEKAVLRRLVEAGTRIVQLGYHGADGHTDVAEVLARARAALDGAAHRAHGDIPATATASSVPPLDRARA